MKSNIIKTVTASEPYGGDPWKVKVTTLNVKHGGLRVEIAVPGEDGPSVAVLTSRGYERGAIAIALRAAAALIDRTDLESITEFSPKEWF